MEATGIIKSMKDFYWDMRPKPEYGTIELRVCDTPLTVERAAALAGYLQALCRHLLERREEPPVEDDYLVYNFNRFQACRFGLDGAITHPKTYETMSLREDILTTLRKMEPHGEALGSMDALRHLAQVVQEGGDATYLRREFERTGQRRGHGGCARSAGSGAAMSAATSSVQKPRLARRAQELVEDRRAVEQVDPAGPVELRVPLQPHHEIGALVADRLDDPVRIRHRLDRDVAPQVLDRLVVDRIDDRPLAPAGTCAPARPGREHDRVAVRVVVACARAPAPPAHWSRRPGTACRRTPR